jgi:AcrR family transcriptional regulator
MASAEGRVWGGLTAREREDRRREQFLDSALELFGTKGWTKTTVLDICRGARLSQRYFYEQFPSREALFLAVVDRIAADVERVVREALTGAEGTPDDRAQAVLEALVDHLAADPRRVRVALVESFATAEFREHRARLLAQFSSLASRLMAAYGGADARGRELSAQIISAGFAEVLVRTVAGEADWTRDEIVDHLRRLYGAAASL